MRRHAEDLVKATTSLHLPQLFFFFNDTATTEIYTLSLHDALPIWFSPQERSRSPNDVFHRTKNVTTNRAAATIDRKSTRLNSSHANISYAVFCLKKKKDTGSVPDWA